MQQALSEKTTKIAELSRRCEVIGSLEDEVVTLTAKLDQAEEETASLQNQIAEKSKQIESLLETEKQLGELKRVLTDATEKLSQANADKQHLVAVVGERQDEITALQQQLGQLDVLRTELSETEDQLKAQVDVNGELRGHNEKLVSELAQMRKDLQQVVEMEKQINVKNQSILELKQQSELQTKAYAKQHDQVVVLREQLENLQGAEEQLMQASERLTITARQRDDFAAGKAELEQQVEKLNTKLELHSNSIADLQRQLETKSKAHQQLTTSNQETTKRLESQIATTKKLQSQLSELASVRSENETLAKRVDDLLVHLKRVSAEHEASLEANETAQESIRGLQAQLHDQTATIRALRRERGSVPGLGGSQNRRAA